MGVIVKFVESIRWYPRGMSAEERRLVFKVDCPVLIYACLSFFTRYLDVSALSKLRTALSLINISKFGASANTKTTQPKTPMFLEWRKICIWLVIDWTTSTQLVREIVQSNKFKVFFWLFGFAWLDEVGYDVFQVPSNILITKYPAHYYLPAIEIFWGLFTLVTAFVTTYEQLVVMRFFVGLSSTACYTGCLTVISS